MDRRWRGIIVSCPLTVLVLTTALFIGVNSAKVVPRVPSGGASSSSDPNFDLFLKNCWKSDKTECRNVSKQIFGDSKRCLCIVRSSTVPPQGGFFNHCRILGKKNCQAVPYRTIYGKNKHCWCLK
ncbi:hypothetical protein N665_0929s0004 [Sinapis alba]|nr:hypothetical protein N665_0929s0004 [Sinapis alba]